MSNVKLKHSSGNGTKLHAPAANPSADITLKVPSTTGSAGQVLAVASANHSSTNAELEWIGAGKVIQVVTAGSTSAVTANSTTAVDITGLSASITCSSATNKVLVFMTVGGIYSKDDANSAVTIELVKDSSVLAQAVNIGMNSTWSLNQMAFLMDFSAAGDTNAHTFKGRFKNRQSGDVKVAQVEAKHFITLMEVEV
jgi:hypothetical protein